MFIETAQGFAVLHRPSNVDPMPIYSGLCNIGMDHGAVLPQRTRG